MADNEVVDAGSDRRSDIEAAFKSVESAAPEPTLEVQEVPVEETPAAAVAAPVEATPVGETAAEKEARERDEKGRFTKKQDTVKADAKIAPEQAKPPVEPPKPPVEEKPEEVVPFEGAKPIQALRPSTREHWSKLPPEAQKDMARWENETKRVLRETADVRERDKRWNETIAPYQHMLRAQSLDPHQFTGSLLQTVAALATAPQQTKAQILANIVRTYSVDIQALDEALSQAGTTATHAPQYGQQSVSQPQVDPRQIAQMAVEQVKAQMTEANARKAVAAFEANPPEFYDDVVEDMRWMLRAAGQRGVDLSIEEAYNRAVWANPELREIVRQREAAKQAANPNGSTQRAKLAASSVKASPSTAPLNVDADDRRSIIEAVMNRASR